MIVDVQRAFDPPPSFVRKLQTYSRRFPCRIFTRYQNPPDSSFRRLLKQHCCAPGTSEVELLIEPTNDDLVFTKSTYGLSVHHLREIKRRKIRQVTVCGLDTDACVLGVMFSLFDAGIECHLKENLCWSSSGLHRPAVAIIRSQFPAPR